MLTERELIDLIAEGRAGAGVRAGDVGIGDDCAVVKVGGKRLLVTIDMMVEGIHFDLSYTPPYFLGRKAVAACLSDIAAMGGTPRALFVSVALPRGRRAPFARALVEGIHEEAEAAGAAVLGGDTCASPGPVLVDVAAVGEAGPGGPVLRRGAKRGDRIYVSGVLGASARGRELLAAGFRPWSRRPWLKDLPASDREAGESREKLTAALAHLRPRPRLAAGALLARKRLASAMIDVSDGLSTDLHNLCEASRVGAEIDSRSLPLPWARGRARAAEGRGAHRKALEWALSGGEDYELLFTVPREAEQRLLRSAPAAFDVPLTRIGLITSSRHGITLVGLDGRARRLPRTGYEHFRR